MVEIQDLAMLLRAEGASVEELNGWRRLGLLAILLGTESGAYYIIEPNEEPPSLVTRLSEAPPFYGEFRMSSSEPIVRRQGDPDPDLEIGKSVDIYGLPRRGTQFDPESLYTTTPLVEIKYLDIDRS